VSKTKNEPAFELPKLFTIQQVAAHIQFFHQAGQALDQ
jgi:hypothetical protein